MLLRVLKWIGIVVLGLVTLTVVGCSTVGLPKVSSKPANIVGQPNLLDPIGGMDKVTSVEAWEQEREPFWRNMLLSQVYGSIPDATPTKLISARKVDGDFLHGKADFYEVQLELTIGDKAFRQDVHFVVPKTAGTHPVILGAGSCPNHLTLPGFPASVPEGVSYPGYCDSSGFSKDLAHFIFGRYVETPPLEQLIDHGFAYGAYYPGMVVPDDSETGMAALTEIRKGQMTHGPYAAIGIWAWVASRLTDYIETSPVLDENRVILFGHSRMGKSSLLAGALDNRIAGVIAHQSGTGGASLQKNDVGESIAQITKSYPHWFTPSYELYTDRAQDMPFDQHALVAMMAPRPLLLGNSNRDKWADPRGSFAAARAAGEVYELYGKDGFNAKSLKDFQKDALLAFQFRPGTHGITPEDWTPFLAWLDARFSDAAN